MDHSGFLTRRNRLQELTLGPSAGIYCHMTAIYLPCGWVKPFTGNGTSLSASSSYTLSSVLYPSIKFGLFFHEEHK